MRKYMDLVTYIAALVLQKAFWKYQDIINYIMKLSWFAFSDEWRAESSPNAVLPEVNLMIQ